jgi:GNAT superfamily N-acetyltransferase
MRGRSGVWAIANVVTRQDRRRQGRARRLMTEAIDAARHGGARQLHGSHARPLGALPVAAIQAAQDEAGATLRRLAAEGAIGFPEEEAA